jgi:hypothetical protein
MTNSSNQVPEFINHEGGANQLWQYVQSMNPETISMLSKPASNEVFQVIERNIVGMLGNLPPEHFGMMVTTSREHLGRLLASAMMSGYFPIIMPCLQHLCYAICSNEYSINPVLINAH